MNTQHDCSPWINRARRNELRTRLGKTVPAVCGFAAGVILGALALSAFSMWSLLLPLAMLAVLGILFRE
ncbi:YoaK family protein [Cupriavidus pinatubonensis]|uniref:hypothetical protein n=1 Tax=Cupriavidus pinatubonensis TaxID=248026 RepID=UPI001CC8116A|nr:hypothetical protein [Cupriavidus pinatubonensis]